MDLTRYVIFVFLYVCRSKTLSRSPMDLTWYVILVLLMQVKGAAVAEWLSSWLAKQEVGGSIPCLATWISEICYLLLPSRDLAEIPLRRHKSSIQPTNQLMHVKDFVKVTYGPHFVCYFSVTYTCTMIVLQKFLTETLVVWAHHRFQISRYRWQYKILDACRSSEFLSLQVKLVVYL